MPDFFQDTLLSLSPKHASSGQSFWKTKVKVNWHVLTHFIREQWQRWEASHHPKHFKSPPASSDWLPILKVPGTLLESNFISCLQCSRHSSQDSPPQTCLSMQLVPPLHEPSDISTPGPAFFILLKNLSKSEVSDLLALPMPKEKPQITALLKHSTQPRHLGEGFT